MKIMVHIDSGANIKSKNVKCFEMDDEDWEGLSDKERDEYVQDFIWESMGAEWGYEEVEG